MALTRRMTIKFSLLILALAALPLTPSKALDMKIYLSRTYPGYSSPAPIGTDEGSNDYLALKPDAERQLRYKKIARFLSGYDYPSPKVPDLDKIVPLPPAKLPKWDGKIKFQRRYEGSSPAKPSDELVRRLAEQAGLDPLTALPLKR